MLDGPDDHAGTDAANALQSSIPVGVKEAVREALGLLGEGPLAVRSSSPAEDLEEASFAGQYETTLGARGEASVMAAVLRSWRSAFAGPAKTYADSEPWESATMAVLIQQLVPAESAGVAFTADPVTGDRSITLVSAVKGLGERLVSGSARPEEWVVQNGTPVRRSGAEFAITAGTAAGIAQLAKEVEGFTGLLVDIEWATAGTEIHLPQARPITTLPAEAADESPDLIEAVDVPPGFWQLDISHVPRPHSPISISLVVPLINDGLSRSFREFGLLAERPTSGVLE